MTPLIFTTRGNVPVDSLAYSTHWELTDDYIKFTETYKAGDEVVKESHHVYSIKPLPVAGFEQASF